MDLDKCHSGTFQTTPSLESITHPNQCNMQLTIPAHQEDESPTSPRCPIAPQAKLEATVASPARARLTSFEAAGAQEMPLNGQGSMAIWRSSFRSLHCNSSPTYWDRKSNMDFGLGKAQCLFVSSGSYASSLLVQNHKLRILQPTSASVGFQLTQSPSLGSLASFC